MLGVQKFRSIQKTVVFLLSFSTSLWQTQQQMMQLWVCWNLQLETVFIPSMLMEILNNRAELNIVSCNRHDLKTIKLLAKLTVMSLNWFCCIFLNGNLHFRFLLWALFRILLDGTVMMLFQMKVCYWIAFMLFSLKNIGSFIRVIFRLSKSDNDREGLMALSTI